MGVIGLWWGIASGDTVTGGYTWDDPFSKIFQLLCSDIEALLLLPAFGPDGCCMKASMTLATALLSNAAVLNVGTLYRVHWPEESSKAQQTLAHAAEQQSRPGDEETVALIPAGRRQDDRHQRASEQP